ncbi:MAG: sigma-70 family RNA polymerase sigma factor [Actinomycetota bacterium]|nr:sigma-70 family RNA polymerase sigma factor [Actinomycetota bacterium]
MTGCEEVWETPGRRHAERTKRRLPTGRPAGFSGRQAGFSAPIFAPGLAQHLSGPGREQLSGRRNNQLGRPERGDDRATGVGYRGRRRGLLSRWYVVASETKGGIAGMWLHPFAAPFASKLVMPLTDTSEADLVGEAKAGNSDSFGELVRRHATRLVGLARQLVGADDAEDMVQEAMLDAWRGIGAFAGQSAFGTWLHRITVNRCLGELRRRKPVTVDIEPLELLARWQDADYSVDPATVAVRRSQAETLQTVLALLPEGYRVALILHDSHGLSAVELAEMTGIPLGTAKSNIRRGRMALVSLLGDDGRDLAGVSR